MRIWVIRCVALLATIVVVWSFGPRAWTVLAAHIGPDGPDGSDGSDGSGVDHGPVVDLDRVGLRTAPAWLLDNQALRRSVFEELSQHLRGEIGLLDPAAAQALTERLQGLSWVAAVRLAPVSNRFTISLELRRPVLEVVPVGSAAGRVPAVYVTADGICVRRSTYDLASGLPRCPVLDGPVRGSLPHFLLGRTHPDPRVLAAAAVAREFCDEMRPLVPGAPALVEVDASNLAYRLLDSQNVSEVRIALARRGGGVTRFDYGHPPGSPMLRVALADKASVLRRVLERYPGLAGLARADLRFVNLWEDWLRPE